MVLSVFVCPVDRQQQPIVDEALGAPISSRILIDRDQIGQLGKPMIYGAVGRRVKGMLIFLLVDRAALPKIIEYLEVKKGGVRPAIFLVPWPQEMIVEQHRLIGHLEKRILGYPMDMRVFRGIEKPFARTTNYAPPGRISLQPVALG